MTLSQSIIFCAVLFYGTVAIAAITIHYYREMKDRYEEERLGKVLTKKPNWKTR